MKEVPEIARLAKATISLLNGSQYGHVRKKLDKNGFSEIALFKAVTDHCSENCIEPEDMANEMLALLEGCGNDVFYPRTHNDFKFLRGCYHQLRHGNLDKGEMKSPEQNGKFLCNKCFLVKHSPERSNSKNMKHTCKFCVSAQVKTAQSNKKKETEPTPPVEETKPNEETNMTAPARTEAHPLAATPSEPEVFTPDAEFTVSEVIADSEEATITIKCPTKSLAFVLGRLEGML